MVLHTYWRRAVKWFLLSGDRIRIAVGLVVLFGMAFGAVIAVGISPLFSMQALFYAYGGLISGNLTLITVVVSINQLLLSRELNTPGELETQIEHVIEYRTAIEDATDQIAPVTPLEFLQLLVEATREEAQRLGGFGRDGVVGAGGDDVRQVATTLTDQMDQIDHLLRQSDSGTFSVLSVMFETNYAQQINRLRRLRARHDTDFPAVVDESIQTLIDRLQEIDIARQYFKTIYFQQELSTLTRWLLYTGVPAEAVLIATLLVLTVPADRPADIPVPPETLVPLTITIGLVPLAVLGSFFWRTATVTSLTAATLPFTTPEQER
ncbi:hypothetical protein [Halohasta litorea]|uniref:Uncharacterized protein n=1 Tax=Halohasta litorea TaxID=869891 RepID=A0ABD6DAQ1_9EURY|nr:hypothetical protein [Halohasta litorea]MEA1932612.1 hypothetical protein [Euryarchaeota archaeon]